MPKVTQRKRSNAEKLAALREKYTSQFRGFLPGQGDVYRDENYPENPVHPLLFQIYDPFCLRYHLFYQGRSRITAMHAVDDSGEEVSLEENYTWDFQIRTAIRSLHTFMAYQSIDFFLFDHFLVAEAIGSPIPRTSLLWCALGTPPSTWQFLKNPHKL